MKFTAIDAKVAPKAVGGYSQAVLIEGVEKLLFISGQVPETSDGRIPPDFDSQCRLVWANVLAQLNAAGMSVANLTKVNIVLSSREDAQRNSTIRQQVLEGHNPALTIIVAGIFDERWLLEIEAIAAA